MNLIKRILAIFKEAIFHKNAVAIIGIVQVVMMIFQVAGFKTTLVLSELTTAEKIQVVSLTHDSSAYTTLILLLLFIYYKLNEKTI